MQTFNNFSSLLRLSGVAALALDQEFGADNIVWNKTGDCIEVKAREGFSLIFGGTNLVEAAIYLPRVFHSLISRLSLGRIPEGVASVRVQVADEAEEFVRAASPLNISLRLSRPSDVLSRLDGEVEASLDRVLVNRSRAALPAGPGFTLPAVLQHCG